MADSGIDLQLKVRQNAAELGDYMKDLDRWEADIKRKDEELKTSKSELQKNLPPIRNQSRKKKSQVKKGSTSSNHNKDANKVPKKISSYDYDMWDKFNVEEELRAIDDKEEMETLTSSSSEEEDEEYQEMIEEERRQQQAVMEKDKGNEFFKEGKYNEAINCYTTAHQLDPSNPIMPANRAIALIKVQRYCAAEEDCNTSLMLDDTYTKAYLRRGVARFHMNKLEESLADYQQVLKLEPGNKQAQHEMEKLHKMLNITQEKDDKPNNGKTELNFQLKRIQIDEIGSDDSEDESEKSSLLPPTNTSKPDEYKSIQVTTVKEVTRISPSSAQHTNEQDKTSSNQTSRQNVESQNTNNLVTKNPVKVFDVPKSSIQLQADWKVLQHNPQEHFEYFKKINPKSYPKLFQQSIDSDMLTTILQIYHDYYIPAKLPVLAGLQCLSQVQRFGMAAMFLSQDHKKVLSTLFSYVQENNEINSSSGESLEALKKKYGL